MRLTTRFILSVLLFGASVPAMAQVHFYRGYQAGEFSYGSCITPGPDGSVFVAGGRSTSGFVQDMLLLNLSATGDPLNIRKLDIDESDYPYSLLDLGGGRLMIGGSSGEFGFQPERDMVLIKTGTTGMLADIHSWGTADSTEILKDLVPYGNDLLVLGGTEYDDVTTQPAFLLLRCDTSYNLLSGIAAHVGPGRHHAGALAVAPDGSVYLVGANFIPVQGESYDAVLFVLKFSANGDMQWARSFDVPGNMDYSAMDAAVATDGSMFVMQSYSNATDGQALFHITEAGELLWCKQFKEPALPGLKFARMLLHDGVIYLAGRNGYSAVDSRPVLMQCSLSGEVVWARKFGPGGSTGGLVDLCIAPTPEGPLALWGVGTLRTQQSEPEQMLLMKVDLQGNGVTECVLQELGVVATDVVPLEATPVVELWPYDHSTPQTIEVVADQMELWTGCLAIGIAETEQGASSLFPNPTWGPCTIAFQDLSPRQITVYDATGRTVPAAATMGHARAHVDLSERPSGVYVIHAVDAAGRSAVQRVLKQ